ncbi:MAG: HNH endonuclease family protein [Lachnospiraceae bacterium]
MSFTLGTKYDIEHIMPYSGNNLQEIRKDAELDSEEEFYGIVNKLGNKILLEERINRAIGNGWFRTKVSTKFENKTGYIDSEYPLARALVSQYQSADKPYWKKDDITFATSKASDRIVEFIFGE